MATTLENFDRLPDSAYVDVYVVAGLIGVGVSTIWKWIQDGNPLIPIPRKFGRNTRFSVGQMSGPMLAKICQPRR